MSNRQMDVEERRLDQDRGMGWRGMECVDGKGKWKGGRRDER